MCGSIDANWVDDLDERKATSEYAFVLNVAISWSNKKQYSIAFLQSLGVVTACYKPCCYHCNSITALVYVKNPKYHGKFKNIDLLPLCLRCSYTKEGHHKIFFCESHGD